VKRALRRADAAFAAQLAAAFDKFDREAKQKKKEEAAAAKAAATVAAQAAAAVAAAAADEGDACIETEVVEEEGEDCAMLTTEALCSESEQD